MGRGDQEGKEEQPHDVPSEHLRDRLEKALDGAHGKYLGSPISDDDLPLSVDGGHLEIGRADAREDDLPFRDANDFPRRPSQQGKEGRDLAAFSPAPMSPRDFRLPLLRHGLNVGVS